MSSQSARAWRQSLMTAACVAALAVTMSLQAQGTTGAKADSGTKNTSVAAKGARPKDASARCGDGTYSTSATSQGTCSGHDGVAYWYAGALCQDGALWMERTKQGACSAHGGVASWIKRGKTVKKTS